MPKLRYRNKDHRDELLNSKTFNLLGKVGLEICRWGKGGGPKNQLIKFDSGELVVCPWGNMENVKGKEEYKIHKKTRLKNWECE